MKLKRAIKSIVVLLFAITLFTFVGCANTNNDDWNGVKVTDDSLAQTMQVKSGIINPPTVVCDLISKNSYDKLVNSEQKPSSVIFRLNNNFDVVDEFGIKLVSFSAFYNNTLKGKIIPIIYISEEAHVQTAITLFNERYDIADAAVMSDDPAYVKTVREACPKIRGIIEFKELDEVYDAVRYTNANRAAVAVLPQCFVSQENVFYIQARFRAVWVRPSSADTGDIREAINSGAYGIVSHDYNNVIKTFGNYDKFSLTRMPFIAAHRGLPNKYNENSVSGVKAAIEAGATHLELDGYLTADNRIVMMHDNTIDRCSDGTGETESFSLAELQNFKLDLFAPNEPIPSIDDIFEIMKGTDVVLLFEIKSQKPEIIKALKTALEKHNMVRQVVVISFYENLLQAMMAELPEIPTANLNAISENEPENTVINCSLLNCGVSTSRDNASPSMNAILRDRGIVVWYWTYSTMLEMMNDVFYGYTGFTTDLADDFVAYKPTRYLFVKGDETVAIPPKIGGEIGLIGVTYIGNKEKVIGMVVHVSDLGNKYAVIASFETDDDGNNSFNLYTQTYYLNKNVY